jgi:hypothetical protein
MSIPASIRLEIDPNRLVREMYLLLWALRRFSRGTLSISLVN